MKALPEHEGNIQEIECDKKSKNVYNMYVGRLHKANLFKLVLPIMITV